MPDETNLDLAGANTAVEQTLRVIEASSERIARLLRVGYGPVYLAFALVTVVVGIVLRITLHRDITPTVFVSLVALAVVFVTMSFAFLILDGRMRQEAVRLAGDQHAKAMELLVDYQQGLREQQKESRDEVRRLEKKMDTTKDELMAMVERAIVEGRDNPGPFGPQ